MALEQVRAYLAQRGMAEKIREFPVSSATVELAGQALGCEGARIAKTLSFAREGGCLIVVAAGDVKIDNAKFRHHFGFKARMLTAQQVPELTGHPVGGVCPFALPEGAVVVLVVSLQRFDTVFPACGSASSAIELTLQELETFSRAKGWTDVCKPYEIAE